MPLQENENDSNKKQNETTPDPKRQQEGERIARRLDWRLEPAKSFSDWRILITDEDDEDAGPLGEYHVHKAVLAFGERASDYFARLFETDMVECQDQCSRISLSKAGAKAFPYLLDFIYQKDITVDTPELYLHLYLLKEYFQVAGMDKFISDGIFNVCRDSDTLIRLDKVARELGIDTENIAIFNPMKRAFIQYTLIEERDLRVFQSRTIPRLGLQFVLKLMKRLDRLCSENSDRYRRWLTPFNEYNEFLEWLDKIGKGMAMFAPYPLERSQLEEAFGNDDAGIWKIEHGIPAGYAAYLSLAVLRLEGLYCEPQQALSRSQMKAINYFHFLASSDGMSPPQLLSNIIPRPRYNRPRREFSTADLLSGIRGDIIDQLMAPGIDERSDTGGSAAVILRHMDEWRSGRRPWFCGALFTAACFICSVYSLSKEPKDRCTIK